MVTRRSACPAVGTLVASLLIASGCRGTPQKQASDGTTEERVWKTQIELAGEYGRASESFIQESREANSIEERLKVLDQARQAQDKAAEILRRVSEDLASASRKSDGAAAAGPSAPGMALVADYWRSLVEFWRSADIFVASSRRVTSGARRVAALQRQLEQTLPGPTRNLLLAKGLVPVLLDALAEKASLSVLYTPDHPGMRASERVLDRLSEAYVVLTSDLSDSEIQEMDCAVRAAVAIKIDALESAAKAEGERHSSDHGRGRQIAASLAALKEARANMTAAEK